MVASPNWRGVWLPPITPTGVGEIKLLWDASFPPATQCMRGGVLTGEEVSTVPTTAAVTA
jgi:hypothetical protein